MTAFTHSSVATLAPVLRGAERGLRRFPLVVAAGALATLAASCLAEEAGSEEAWLRLLFSAVLAVPLFTGVRLLGESRRWGAGVLWVANAAAFAVVTAFYWGQGGWSEVVQAERFMQLLAVFGLFLMVAPNLTGPESRSFWWYNAMLVERVVLAALYALVLFAGAAIALAALDNLFGVEIPETAYARLWFIAVFLLSPWFFVAGIPQDLDGLGRVDDYPRGLRAFTRFALLPIVAVYLVILQAYFVKVLITWAWPSGWIGWLVTAVALAGILSLALVLPLQDRPADGWVRTYARWFHVLLLPAIVMLWFAIWQRVAQYGLTERRYFLLILSVWLAAIAVWQIATKMRGIRIIPVSLCLVGLVTFMGPWGAYRVSEGSQVRRLAGLLEAHGMLTEGRVRPATGEVPVGARREITAVLEYLGETYGFAAIADWFPESLRAEGEVLADLGPPERYAPAVERLMAALAIRPAAPAPTEAGPFRFSVRLGDPVPVEGAAALVRVPRWAEGTPPDSGWAARGEASSLTLRVYRDGRQTVAFPLAPLVEALRSSGAPRGGVEADRLMVESAEPGVGRLYLRTLAGRVERGTVIITDVAGEVLLAERGTAQ